MIDGGCYEDPNGRMMHGSGREIATPLEKRKRPTRKEMHAEGIKFLQTAMEAADQADSCFRDAGTVKFIEVKMAGHWIGVESLVRTVMGLLRESISSACEDCNKPIADCACAWANEEVK